MTDDEIDTSDIPEADEDFFNRARLRMPKGKSSVILSVDSEVLDWFRGQGGDYHKLVNSALRDFAETHR